MNWQRFLPVNTRRSKGPTTLRLHGKNSPIKLAEKNRLSCIRIRLVYSKVVTIGCRVMEITPSADLY